MCCTQTRPMEQIDVACVLVCPSPVRRAFFILQPISGIIDGVFCSGEIKSTGRADSTPFNEYINMSIQHARKFWTLAANDDMRSARFAFKSLPMSSTRWLDAKQQRSIGESARGGKRLGIDSLHQVASMWPGLSNRFVLADSAGDGPNSSGKLHVRLPIRLFISRRQRLRCHLTTVYPQQLRLSSYIVTSGIFFWEYMLSCS